MVKRLLELVFDDTPHVSEYAVAGECDATVAGLFVCVLRVRIEEFGHNSALNGASRLTACSHKFHGGKRRRRSTKRVVVKLYKGVVVH
eukprot:COSAG02_NODE_4399_length_5405_cov_1.917075_2_plen_88_part_00